jgi:hypothetical protein
MSSIYNIVNLSIPTEMWEFFLGGMEDGKSI